MNLLDWTVDFDFGFGSPCGLHTYEAAVPRDGLLLQYHCFCPYSSTFTVHPSLYWRAPLPNVVPAPLFTAHPFPTHCHLLLSCYRRSESWRLNDDEKK